MRSFPDEDDGRAVGAGMVLLQDGDAKVALPHLTLTATTYPKMAAVQAMLGQACSLNGDRTGALIAYRKASELLPGDETVGGLRAYWKHVIEQGLKELGSPEK